MILGSVNKGYVRFQTAEMKQLIPPYSKPNGWREKEPILFEIDYWWNSKQDNSDTRIFFKVVISPGENERLIETLRQIIESVEGSKAPYGKKWLAYFTFKKKYDWNAVNEDESNIQEYIDSAWEKIIPVVEKVNQAIIDNSQKIKDCL